MKSNENSPVFHARDNNIKADVFKIIKVISNTLISVFADTFETMTNQQTDETENEDETEDEDETAADSAADQEKVQELPDTLHNRAQERISKNREQLELAFSPHQWTMSIASQRPHFAKLKGAPRPSIAYLMAGNLEFVFAQKRSAFQEVFDLPSIQSYGWMATAKRAGSNFTTSLVVESKKKREALNSALAKRFCTKDGPPVFNVRIKQFKSHPIPISVVQTFLAIKKDEVILWIPAYANGVKTDWIQYFEPSKGNKRLELVIYGFKVCLNP
jgi:hypothetical protein